MIKTLANIVRGFPGKPSHPPLTDASIGAYTVVVAMLILGALGVEEIQMAHGAQIAIAGGLVLADGAYRLAPHPKGTPARTAATIHMVAMIVASVLFVGTWLLQPDGYGRGEVTTPGLVAGLLAEGALVAGGFVGGALAFVYGVRVLKRPHTPVVDALVPGRVPTEGREKASSSYATQTHSPDQQNRT